MGYKQTNKQTNRKQATSQIWLMGCSLPTPDLLDWLSFTLLLLFYFANMNVLHFTLENFPCFEVCSSWKERSLTPAFLWSVLLWYILHPFTFNLHVSLYLKPVSSGQHTVGSCVLIHSDNLCAFRPMTFKVIIDIVGLISTISVTIFYLLPLFFVSVFVFYSFSTFCGFNWAFFSLSFLSITIILFFSFRVCNVHLQLFQVPPFFLSCHTTWLADLSSPTRDQTHGLSSKSTVLTTGPPGNSPKFTFK